MQNAMDVIEQGIPRAVRVLIGYPASTACTNLVKPTAPSVAPNVALFGCTCLRCLESYLEVFLAAMLQRYIFG